MKLQLLMEATFNVDKLVDHIYNEVYEDFVNEVQQWMNGEAIQTLNLKIKNKLYDTQQLDSRTNSKQIQKALEMNPITLTAGVYSGGNYYLPREKTIQISFNSEIYEFVQNMKIRKLRFWDAVQVFSKNDIHRIMNELDGTKVRASIAHELSHWLDDTFHNRHIGKMVNQSRTTNQSFTTILKIPNIGLSSFERDANIHALVEIKRRYTDEQWDMLTFEDLKDLDASLHVVSTKVMAISRQLHAKWKKQILKRMHREGILGKKMR